MPTPSFDPNNVEPNLQQIYDYLFKLTKEMNYLLSNLDNRNIVQVAGFLATATLFESKNGLVGLSSADPGDPNAIRFWAGNADPTQAPFRVQEDGAVFGSSMTIEGGVIRTNPVGQARIELSGNTLTTYTTGDVKQGIQWGQGFAGSTYGDVGFFDSGTETFRIENRTAGGGWVLKPMGSSGLGVGWTGHTTQAHGDWVFDGSVNLGSQTATGRVQYANQADSALSASSAQSVDWSNVTNHPDGTTTPLMDGTGAVGTSTLYSRQDHRHPSDTTKQATITGAATTITTSNLTASRALSSDSSGKVAVSAVTSTEQGYLSGVTSAIQTQLNGKAAKLSGTQTWTTPTFQNSWVANTTTGYYIDDMGIVHLKGTIKSGTATTGTVIFNLPAGYRPGQNFILGVLTSNGAGGYNTGRIDVNATGDVIVNTVNNSFVSLDGISFRAEQ